MGLRQRGEKNNVGLMELRVGKPFVVRPGQARPGLPVVVYFLVLSALASVPAMLPAQDLALSGPSLSGRLDSLAYLLAPEDPGIEGLDPALTMTVPDSETWTMLGRVSGWIGVSGGSRDIKAELRLGLDTWPEPSLDLSRAWIKFRVPGLRASLGLGSISWGPGFVFCAGDILNESTGLGVDFSADQLRSSTGWLGDFWFALGPESFLEIQARTPGGLEWQAGPGLVLTVPQAAWDGMVGARISVSPEDVLLEAAYALDGKNRFHKFSLSTQFHAGLDWYASLRYDLPTELPSAWAGPEGLALTAGAFGMADLGEGFSLSSRHEALVLPGESWDPAIAGPLRLPGQAGAGLPLGLYSFHDLSLAFPESFAYTLRALVSWVDGSALVSGELDWSGLQGLTLYFSTSVQAGDAAGNSGGAALAGTMGDTFAAGRQGWFSLGLGARVRF